MPDSRWKPADAMAIAARLVTLLPAAGTARADGSGKPATPQAAPANLRWVMVLVLLSGTVAGLMFNQTRPQPGMMDISAKPVLSSSPPAATAPAKPAVHIPTSG
jgi:hypothetical protein